MALNSQRSQIRRQSERPGPLISIITVCRNAEECIAATVESVSSQSFSDFEHLIIDGASTDGTLARARLAHGRRMRIVSEPDDGLYDAMNKGLRLARGKYVLFLNAGDAFHTTETLLAYADAIRSFEADIVYGDTDIVDTERNFLRPRHLKVPQLLTSHSFLKGMLVCHQAFMIRRELAPEFNTAYRFSADYDWCIRGILASRPGRRINLNEVVIDYLDAGMTEQNKLKSLAERFQIMRNHYGTAKTIAAHLSFIPRMIRRRIAK